MVEEEEQKLKIFNTVHMNHLNDTPKKKFFMNKKKINFIEAQSEMMKIYKEGKYDYKFKYKSIFKFEEKIKNNKSKNSNNRIININITTSKRRRKRNVRKRK